MGRKRRQRQQLIFQEPQEQEEQEQKPQIIINESVCMKENRVKAIYKIQHNVWFNRARRRFKKASYFSERA
jgi:hypothetical protein